MNERSIDACALDRHNFTRFGAWAPNLHLHHPHAQERLAPPLAAPPFQSPSDINISQRQNPRKTKGPSSPEDSGPARAWLFAPPLGSGGGDETGLGHGLAAAIRVCLARRKLRSRAARSLVEKTLSRTPRAIARERPRTHPEARPERRRHAVQRRAAVAADFQRRRLHPQPVTARGTFRIQALHGPAGQVLHPDSPRMNVR